MSFERMLDKEHRPTAKEITDYLGRDAAEAWNDIVAFLEDNYNFTPEAVFGGKKYGWAVRYRRSGKSLCTLHPEKGAFTVLIVLGGGETEQTLADLPNFSPDVANLISGAKQYHDGRWLWLRVLSKDDITDIKHLLQIKKKPQKRKNSQPLID
jgi:hypothetical protein